jgi:hypothetical protein
LWACELTADGAGLAQSHCQYRQWFFFVKFFFSIVFWAINELDCEHVSSQLMAQGLLITTAGTGSCFLLVKFIIFAREFQTIKGWFVSIKPHSWWPRACSQRLPVLAVVFSILNICVSSEFWAINELDCEYVSSKLMALGLLTAIADSGSGIFHVKFLYFNWVLNYQ